MKIRVIVMLGIVTALLAIWFLLFSDPNTLTIRKETADSQRSFVAHSTSDSTETNSADTNQITGAQISDESLTLNDQSKAIGTVSRLASVRRQGRSMFQESYVEKKYNGRRSVRENQRSIINGGGSSYRLMEFSRGIGALLAMYEATDEKQYMEEALDLSEKIIVTAKRGRDIKNNPEHFKDDFIGWANQNPNFKTRRSGGEHLREVPLFESYLFRYLAKISYLLLTTPALKNDPNLVKEGRELYNFVKRNGWEKWYERGEKQKPGCYPYLFRQRTHMTSHWAVVALYLRELSDNSREKEVYSNFLSLYDRQLKDNFRTTKDNAYVWNMTWDSAWPYGSKCNNASRRSIIQDVSHGNHVVTYIVEAHELSSSVWKETDIQHLVNTVKYIIYDADKNSFNNDLAGKFSANTAAGIQMSDGFVKLARYDEQLVKLFEKVNESQRGNVKFSLDEPQFVAELTLARKILVEN